MECLALWELKCICVSWSCRNRKMMLSCAVHARQRKPSRLEACSVLCNIGKVTLSRAACKIMQQAWSVLSKIGRRVPSCAVLARQRKPSRLEACSVLCNIGKVMPSCAVLARQRKPSHLEACSVPCNIGKMVLSCAVRKTTQAFCRPAQSLQKREGDAFLHCACKTVQAKLSVGPLSPLHYLVS
eukprot:28031-Pelagomonas_calceolata.AAC.2